MQPVTDCTTRCCGVQAVRKTSELQLVLDALSQGCPTSTVCTMACPDVVVACVNGRCESLSDRSDGGVDGGTDGG